MAEDPEVYRLLGQLVEGQRSQQEATRRLEEALARSDAKSDSSRAIVHRRIDEMVDRTAALETDVRTVTSDIREMKPVTEKVRNWEKMGIGALGMVGIGGVALGVSFSDALQRLAGLLTGRLG